MVGEVFFADLKPGVIGSALGVHDIVFVLTDYGKLKANALESTLP